MRNSHGSFIWYELVTGDPDAAGLFYSDVIGWQVSDSGQAGMDYRIFSHEGTGVGGLMALPPGGQDQGMRPGWLGYIGVDDVDQAVAKVRTDGGEVHMEPWDIADVGRIAMVADPQGVPFYVMRGASEEASTAFHPRDVGRTAWNELVTTDQAAALEFYTRHFGWERAGAMPMGALGDYVFIAHDGQPLGAMMNKPADEDRPKWNFYVRVGDIDEAAERVRGGGGEVLEGPMEVPGGDFVIVGRDPQGARFGLVGGRG